MTNKSIKFNAKELIGRVENVTSNRIIINLVDTDKNEYSAMVGDILAIASTNKTEFTIASITDVSRTYVNNLALITNEQGSEQIDDGILNQIEATFLGSLSTVTGTEVNTFRRGIKCFPTLGNSVYTFSPNNLSLFMDSISHSSDNTSLTLGKYAIDSISKANLNGDRFFQRHAAILGSTGSGKSWLVSKLLEDANKLSFSNIIIFDIHGEYHPLTTDNGGFAKYLKIAGPSDTEINDKNLFIPYWLLNRDELQSILLDRADKDAPNQANRFNYHLLNLKKENAEDTVITVDSPIPFNLQELINLLKDDDEKKYRANEALKKDLGTVS